MKRYKPLNERSAYKNISHNMGYYLEDDVENLIQKVMKEFSTNREEAIIGIANFFETEIYNL